MASTRAMTCCRSRVNLASSAFMAAYTSRWEDLKVVISFCVCACVVLVLVLVLQRHTRPWLYLCSIHHALQGTHILGTGSHGCNVASQSDTTLSHLRQPLRQCLALALTLQLLCMGFSTNAFKLLCVC